MTYIDALRIIWKRSKYAYLVMLRSLLTIVPFSFFTLGNNLLKDLRIKFENEVRTPFAPTKKEFDELWFFAALARNIFFYENEAYFIKDFPDYTDHVVGEYKGCRYCLMRKNNNVYISIRGSANMENWVDGLTSTLVQVDSLGKKIHTGYNDIALGILNEINPYLKISDDIYLTGISMGHSMAIILSFYLGMSPTNTIKKVYGFGGPKITDFDYGKMPVTNVFIKNDPVVHLPSFSIFSRYRHQGNHIVLDNDGWFHYKDCTKTDFLLSPYLLDSPLILDRHHDYIKEIRKLGNDLGYAK